MNSTNTVVANALAAHGVARNSVEVEVSLMYAGRVQHAMRDAARSVSGVRVTGTNTLSCPDEDAADEVVDILEQAGVPKREISLNAKRVARNVVRVTGKGRINFDDDVVEVFDPNGRSVYKGIWDDCPYKRDDMRYDGSTMTYRADGPNGDYRIIAKIG